ncbi:response regulator [Mucilaginibacter sp.]|uniref:response regulator n=1 Tax=Mucilaginibacter sp. TaxID=1882438 RepID=UPI003D0D7F4C
MKFNDKIVLIFDDDEDILSICSYILEENGFTVHTSTNCKDIVSKVEQINPHVILMDNWIPDQGGVVATQQLKKSNTLQKIPVIYFSANNDIKAIAEKAGADSYISKPFDLDQLISVINSCLI